MVNPIVFQVVGYQNSGKTTFLKSLINQLTYTKYKVGTIKHHGHGGKPDVMVEKDSAKYCQSGAMASLVEGDGRFLLQAEKNEWTLLEQIQILSMLKLDIILVEGHKYASFPKALIINDDMDLQLLKNLTNIELVLFRNPALREDTERLIHVPTFYIDDMKAIEWIIYYIKEQLDKNS